MQLFVEKYRPQKFEDIIGIDASLINNIKSNLPHLLFSGQPGTGKTTLAKVIIKELGLDSITLNASDERGIDVIRDKIKTFASTRSQNDKVKLILLDEADALTGDSQTCLRNVMETYSNNCRFILTCNYLNKIIEPIQSRCIKVEFGNIKKEDIIKRLQFICKQENITYEDSALIKILKHSKSDIRKAINKIQEMSGGVLLSEIKNETEVAKEVFALLKQKKFTDARQKYLDAQVDNEQFLKDLYFEIFNSAEKPEFKKQAIFEIAECYKWLSQVAWKEILIENMFLRLIEKC